MMNDFLKRMLLTAAYWLGAMCLIHFVMGTDPGYQGHRLFVFTGQIVSIISLILKIALFMAAAAAVFYFIVFVIQIHDSWQEHKAEEEMKKNDEEVATRAAFHHAMVARARELEVIEEKKRKDQELEEHLQRRHLEKYGPRSEDDALAKAMDSIKLGGFE